MSQRWIRLAADALDSGEGAMPSKQELAVLLRCVADLSDPMINLTRIGHANRAAEVVAQSILRP